MVIGSSVVADARRLRWLIEILHDPEYLIPWEEWSCTIQDFEYLNYEYDSKRLMLHQQSCSNQSSKQQQEGWL